MRRKWNIVIGAVAAGGLAAGLALAALPAANLSATAARSHRAGRHEVNGPTRAEVVSMVKKITSPDKRASLPADLAPQSTAGVADVGSFNWAGYADLSTTPQYFTGVSGSWTVPAVSCTPEDRMVANWVGIDGANDETVEQTGTISWCFEGTAHYYSWYEMYPTPSVTVGTTVRPGDQITASVTRTGDSYSLKLVDSTTPRNSLSYTATCSPSVCLDESAEWITERPAFGTTTTGLFIGIVPLAQFRTAQFADATASGGGKTGSIGAFTAVLNITMIDATQTYALATTGNLTPSRQQGHFFNHHQGSQFTQGSAFTNRWLNSY